MASDLADIPVECEHCGHVIYGRPGLVSSALSRHEAKCAKASEDQRNAFLSTGKWPKDTPKIEGFGNKRSRLYA